MTVRVTETVWLGHDNLIDLQLWKKGPADSGFVEADLSSVTRMVLKLDSTVIDSETETEVFDWSTGDGKVTIALGDQEITAATYTSRLITYDPQNDDGIVWGEFDLVVRS